MKASIVLFLFLPLAVFAQNRIPVGGVDCSVVYEVGEVSPHVNYIATNDIANYFHSVSGFGKPETNDAGIVRIRQHYEPNLVDRTALFEDGISFLIDGGATNCTVASMFTESLAAWNEPSTFAFRTNLVKSAGQFLSDVSSGSFSGLSPAMRRKLFRTLTAGTITDVPAAEAADSDIDEALSDYQDSFHFEPLCYSELELVPNVSSAFVLPVRAVPVFAGNRESFIMRIRLLYSDERWSFLY